MRATKQNNPTTNSLTVDTTGLLVMFREGLRLVWQQSLTQEYKRKWNYYKYWVAIAIRKIMVVC